MSRLQMLFGAYSLALLSHAKSLGVLCRGVWGVSDAGPFKGHLWQMDSDGFIGWHISSPTCVMGMYEGYMNIHCHPILSSYNIDIYCSKQEQNSVSENRMHVAKLWHSLVEDQPDTF